MRIGSRDDGLYHLGHLIYTALRLFETGRFSRVLVVDIERRVWTPRNPESTGVLLAGVLRSAR